MEEASRNFVLPIDVRTLARAVPSIARQPDLMAGRNWLALAEGMTGMSENVFIDIKNRSKTIVAEVVVPEDGGNGAILVQGGRFGGWALYLQDGVPAYHYNFLNMQRFTVTADKPLAPGSRDPLRVRLRQGRARQGRLGTFYVNDQKVGEGRIERTQPRLLISADETADVGIDLHTPVVEAIGAGSSSRFHRPDRKGHRAGGAVELSESLSIRLGSLPMKFSVLLPLGVATFAALACPRALAIEPIPEEVRAGAASWW